jgi:hypothetical protein
MPQASSDRRAKRAEGADVDLREGRERLDRVDDYVERDLGAD